MLNLLNRKLDPATCALIMVACAFLGFVAPSFFNG